MKKWFILCIFCPMVIILLVVGCGWVPRNTCDFCRTNPASDEFAGVSGENICESCVRCMRSPGRECANCGGFYRYDSWFTTPKYCYDCVEEFTRSCDICGGGCIDLYDMVNVTEDYHICARCLEDYFKDHRQDRKDLETYVVSNSVLVH